MEKEKDINKCQKVLHKHYVVAFWITLGISIGLMVGSAWVPPLFVIDGSTFKAVGLLFLWPALAFAALAVESGRVAKFNFGQGSIHIGEDENNDGFDDNWKKEQEEDV
jgi:hypothetical protein